MEPGDALLILFHTTCSFLIWILLLLVTDFKFYAFIAFALKGVLKVCFH